MKQLLSVKGVGKRFGGVVALDNCSLAVEQGTITALIGPNGSGKTTLFDAISGIIDEDAGEILFKGENISKHTPRTAYKVAKAGISRTFQQVRLFHHLTIRDHLRLALRLDDTSMLRSLIAGNAGSEPLDGAAQRVLNLVKLEKSLDTCVTDLSYGQRKLLDLAIAIAKPHTLLMLDEPVAGVNPLVRESIKDVLCTLRANGETIFLIEHDMNFTMQLADYVFVLDAGSVISHGKPKAVQKDKRVLAAYLGESRG